MNDRILYIGDTEGVSGYAQSTRRVIFSLQDAGSNIFAKYVPHDINISRDINSLNRIRSLYGSVGNVAIHQQIPHMFQPIQNAYNIGFTMFETTRIPSEWLKYISKMDEIWVPSQHNKNIFIRSGVTVPVHVVPLPVDTSVFYIKNKPNDVFRFLSLFQWTERKNWKNLLLAYFSEFSYNDNTELYLKVYAASDSIHEKVDIQNQINAVIRDVNNLNRPRYILDFSIKSEQEIAVIHQNAHVFVLPSRGEALGLTYLESMACGNPCIATAWGGQTEFVNDANGYLVDYVLEPVSGMPHIREYKKDQEWARVKLDSLQSQMRKAFNDKPILRDKGEIARKTSVDRYSMPIVAQFIQERLSKIKTLNITNKNTKIATINYRGDAYGFSGYSNAIRLNIRSLKHINAPVRLSPVHHDRRQIEDSPMKEMLSEISKLPSDSKILIDHQTPEFFDTENKSYKYKIGVTYFETTKIPDIWVTQCNKMDEIWLACEDNKKSFQSSGVKSRIEIIEPYLDTDHFHPSKKPWNITNKASTTFLSLFEFIPRKGWDVLVEAFATAFKNTDDVCLIIKTHRSHPPMKESEIKQAMKESLNSKNIYEWPRILVYTDAMPYESLPSLYTASDVFVLPTRGESICYPALEAMSCGKPCIITGSGGQSNFVNKENGYPIGFKLAPVENFNHSPWYTGDQMITEPNLAELVSIFRHIYKNPEEVKRKGISARQYVETKHSMQSGYERIANRIREISNSITL